MIDFIMANKFIIQFSELIKYKKPATKKST